MPQMLSGTYAQRIAQNTTVLYPLQGWYQTDSVDTGGGVMANTGYYQWTGLAWSSANPDVFNNITEIINVSTANQQNYTATNVMYADPSSSSSGSFYAQRIFTAIRAAVSSSVNLLGGTVYTLKDFGTGAITNMTGQSMALENHGAPATITQMTGITMLLRNWLTTVVGKAQGMFVSVTNVGTGAMTAQEGVRISLTNTGGGSVTHATSLLINVDSAATNNKELAIGVTFSGGNPPAGTYSIYTADTNPNYMAGSITIGNTSVPSGGGTPVLIMTDAVSNPTGMPTNTAGIFAKDVAGTTKLFAIDEAGAVTQLTP